ncbi:MULTISPECIES: molybdopterin oxidoreductase family protein [unclassified Rhodococcus (in: high G+C Gram-positive bacteria)]|uniref:molybdopterin oxidoreductase family protein n=1 Tax=unclassified Rhodococcus (in: high G+C Gram-positive bacteria) TaxID=192944 RepID=UPI000E0A9833|nr:MULTISPECIES: molybdopterin oxidoreductase family protein [unclassified Rhodococcus (in: high G+C Gram-positive bacteria)]QKT12503.1 molybdopterin oxidoreductase family protein [Rhodococcus sp. W8901]RDI25806.1 assimilatory nitrate reductase catalytic subunit [Rhodococcus sp. AG1013]
MTATLAAATATHCPYCGLQCAMTLTREAGSVTVAGRQFPTNRGGLCQKGWTSAELLRHPDRLTTPLVRDAGTLRRATWPEALDRVVDGFRSAQDAGGRDAVGIFGGGGLTNEKAYMLGKFARVALGTSNIDYNGRFCMSSAAAAGIRAFGLDRGLPFPVSDLTSAKAILLAGGNVAETMPPLVGHLTAAADSGGLIVADPRRTATVERALAGGGLHLQLAPGTDLPLALGMLHLAVTEGHLDREYVEARTDGFGDTWLAAAQWWPERTERVTGVPVASLRRAVEILSRSRRNDTGAYVLTARGAEQHATGTDTVSAWIALALTLGLPGRRGSGYGAVTGQGNGQGGREHGQKADQLPGYRKITDPVAREHVARVWGIDPADLPGPGRSAYELLDALGRPDGPRALMVHGANLAVSAPRAGHVVDRLRSLDLLVVCDFLLSETAAMADVVLPVLQWAEEEGTMTSLEGRVLRRRRATTPPDGARGELEVWRELAVRLGQPASRFPTSPEVVFDELRRASAGGVADYAGVTYARLDAGEALHWPCPDVAHPGTPRLFLDRFATDDGRARFTAVEHRGPAEPTDTEFPLLATTGRVLAHYQSGAQSRRVAELAAAAGPMFVQVHPDTAARVGLRDGDAATVVARRGRVAASVRCDESMRLDTVFLPFHFAGDARANLLTNPALDPTSRMPEFKVCAVRLEAGAGVRP